MSRSVFIPKTKRDETLAQKPQEGKRLLEPYKGAAKGAPINILEDHKVSNEAEVHRHEADLWICLEGEVDFVVGGELVDPWTKELPDGSKDTRELKAKEIKDGTSFMLHEGDVLYIPAGEPHLHKTIETARLFIVKVPESEFSLEKVPGWKEKG